MKLVLIENTFDCKTFLIDFNGATIGTITSFKNKYIIHIMSNDCNTLFTVEDFNEAISLISKYVLEVDKND